MDNIQQYKCLARKYPVMFIPNSSLQEGSFCANAKADLKCKISSVILFPDLMQSLSLLFVSCYVFSPTRWRALSVSSSSVCVSTLQCFKYEYSTTITWYHTIRRTLTACSSVACKDQPLIELFWDEVFTFLFPEHGAIYFFAILTIIYLLLLYPKLMEKKHSWFLKCNHLIASYSSIWVFLKPNFWRAIHLRGSLPRVLYTWPWRFNTQTAFPWHIFTLHWETVILNLHQPFNKRPIMRGRESDI